MEQGIIIDEFRRSYYERMRIPANVTSERRVMLDNLEKMNKLVEPQRIPRFHFSESKMEQVAQMQELLGRFRDHELDRKCITDDMDIIRFYVEKLNVAPPSFVEAGPRRFLYHDPAGVRVALLTSGGIAPGLNTVVESIVRKHREVCAVHGSLPSHETTATRNYSPLSDSGVVRGFYDGFIGLTEDRSRELLPNDVKAWCRFGGSKLGVGRTKPSVGRWIEVLSKNQIGILYVIGGNGSLAAAHEIAQEAIRHKMDISVAVIPKTMDNDVLWVWQSFGFVTAVEKATEIINILHTEAESNRRVCVIQLFGAKSGHVAANAALASGEVDAVLIPEEGFDINLVSTHIARRVNDYRHAVVVMAEGARAMYNKDGKWKMWATETREQRDANFHRMQQELWKGLSSRGLSGHEVFGNQPQHTIRSIAANSHDQVYCRRLADMAVDTCLGGYTDFMISSWLTEYVIVPLVFPAKHGLTEEGFKTFPTGGIFWRTVLRSTGQPSFLSPEAREAQYRGEVEAEQ
jgi:6-phosphofructokinase 1